MASVCHFQSVRLPLLYRPTFSKPSATAIAIAASPPTSLSLKRSSSFLRASFTANTPAPADTYQTPIPLPLAAAVVAAAALFFYRLRSPAPALAAVSFCPPPAAAATAAVEPETLPTSGQEPDSSEALSDADEERILEQHLDSWPDDPRALRALMEIKVATGKLPEAIGILDRLIALEPDEKELPLLKAHLRSYNGDTEIAKREFEELIEKDPFLVEAYHGLVMVAGHYEYNASELDGIVSRVKDAMELCKKAKRNEDLRDFKLLMAQIRVVQGKYEDALKIYQELAKEDPKDFRPYLCQGIIYTLLMKKDDAEKQFEKYRRLVPKGHPYAQYFDENMIAVKVFGQMEENRRKAPLKG